MRGIDTVESTPPDCTSVARRDTCQRPSELTPETHLDHAPVGVKFGVATNEVVHVASNGEGRTERPRERRKQPADQSRRVGAEPPKVREPTKRSSCGHDGEFSDACAQENGKAEPLRERQTDGVRTDMVAELVRHDARQFVVIEVPDGERADDEYVATAGECIDVVALVDCDNETSSRGARGGNHDANGAREATKFVGVRRADAEHPRQKDPLRERKKHDDGTRCNDAHEDHVRRIEGNCCNEPDQ